MAETTPLIIYGVVAWLLATGATLLFVRLVWVGPVKKANQALQKENNIKSKDLELLKKVVSDLKTDTILKIEDLENRHATLTKTVGNHKDETTKIFETVTEGFEFVNNERVTMIKDLAELKRRVRMSSNEAKRQTYQRRHRADSGTV